MGLAVWTACGGGTVAYIWVIGTQFNQIAGFKVHDFKPAKPDHDSHFALYSGGTNPVSIVVRRCGRYARGQPGHSGDGNCRCAVPGQIAEFSVGGEGVLTFQQGVHQPGLPIRWATIDSAGNFLYVLDQIAPDGSGQRRHHGKFAIDSTTGRLQACGLIRAIKNPTTGQRSSPTSPLPKAEHAADLRHGPVSIQWIPATTRSSHTPLAPVAS